MLRNLNLVPLFGTVTTTGKLNLRKGTPSTDAPIADKVDVGASLTVKGLVQGQSVHGNTEWYAGGDNIFFWSGGVGDFRPEGGAPGLTSPIAAVHRRANGTICPLLDQELRSTFGNVIYSEAPNGRVVVDTHWESATIVTLPAPQLASIGYSSLRVHTKARQSFENVLKRLGQGGLHDRIVTCAGTFVPRHKNWDRNRDLSPHTWGIAIDVNAQWNGYGVVPAPLGAHGSVRELVPHFEAEGFAWGGHFQSARDGMHFELARYDL